MKKKKEKLTPCPFRIFHNGSAKKRGVKGLRDYLYTTYDSSQIRRSVHARKLQPRMHNYCGVRKRAYRPSVNNTYISIVLRLV